MQEIVSVDAVTRLFLALAVLSPVVGILVAGILSARRVPRATRLLWGWLIGLCGPVNWLLWRLYNVLTDRNGLDTVRNFEINLVVFVLIGLGFGLALNRLQPTAPDVPAPTLPSAPSDPSEQEQVERPGV